MTGEWPKDQVDHINQVKDDNRWCNIRECNSSQNKGNELLRADNTSGYKGVVWDKDRNKWRAQISINNKQTNLGRFDCKYEAARAYNEAAIEHFGEFACLNDVTMWAGLGLPFKSGGQFDL